MPLLSHRDLYEIAVKKLLLLNVPDEQAAVIADSLIEADLRGVSSHGIARLPSYFKRVRAGVMEAVTKVRLISEGPSYILIDGGNGFGQVAAKEGIELAIKKAKSTGVALVGCRNTNHIGMAAYYGKIAAKEKMIGLVLANSSPAMAPWGGKKPMLGTSPLCITAPGHPEYYPYPLVLDMATSVVARGKIRLALKEGKEIPLGWALDPEGNPTTDPEKALKGTLLPIGKYKGYGLAFFIDLIAGLLVGSAFNGDVGATTDLSRPINSGFMVGAINIDSFIPFVEYLEKIREYIISIKKCPKAPWAKEIYLPGEIEEKIREERLLNGIPIPESVLAEVESLS